MRKSTINLTKKELLFAGSAEYPLTKQIIIKKLIKTLQDITPGVAEKHHNLLLINKNEPIAGKLSRGDNYRGMPYLVMDTPQIKGQDFPVLFRMMFWWGHYFVLHFYIKKEHTTNLNINGLKGSYINKSDKKLWENDLDHKSWIKLKDLSTKKLGAIADQNNYIHLATKVKLKDHHRIGEISTKWLEVLEKRIEIKKRKPEQSGS